jgi:hypothetical protein
MRSIGGVAEAASGVPACMLNFVARTIFKN